MTEYAPSQSRVDFARGALAALHALDTALTNHLEWLKDLHRVMVCGGMASPADLAADADHHCLFGKWYYGQGMRDMGSEPGFIALEEGHRAMHAMAARLLARKGAGAQIDAADYDAFIELAVGFKQHLRRFQYEIMNRICVVDQLTGVWNRHAMYLRLAEEIERIQRSHQPCTLCMMDLDHFKLVNDTCGHQVGDVVLQGVSSFLSNRLRRYDSVFRFGGEEFLLCLPDTPLHDAGERLRQLSGELAVLAIETGAGPLSVTASFGVAPLEPLLSIDESIELADRALLCAKARGRNQVCVWDGDLEKEDVQP